MSCDRHRKKSPKITWIFVFIMRIRTSWVYSAKNLSGCGSSLPKIIRSYGGRLKKKRCYGRQIARMDAFVETMRKMNSLENRKLITGEISAGQLEKEIQAELAILEKEYKKQCLLQVPEAKEKFWGDKEIILEVAENLLSNAFHYGKQQIVMTVKTGYSELSICVRDDGDGFLEDAEKITQAFYGQNVKDSLKHAGIGMYISRLYCEKHGGKLILGNDEQKGAVVTALFRRIA